VWFARLASRKDGLDFEHDACSRQKQRVWRLISTRATNPLIMRGFWRQYISMRKAAEERTQRPTSLLKRKLTAATNANIEAARLTQAIRRLAANTLSSRSTPCSTVARTAAACRRPASSLNASILSRAVPSARFRLWFAKFFALSDQLIWFFARASSNASSRR
jgi:hypothetical protein